MEVNVKNARSDVMGHTSERGLVVCEVGNTTRQTCKNKKGVSKSLVNSSFVGVVGFKLSYKYSKLRRRKKSANVNQSSSCSLSRNNSACDPEIENSN